MNSELDIITNNINKNLNIYNNDKNLKKAKCYKKLMNVLRNQPKFYRIMTYNMHCRNKGIYIPIISNECSAISYFKDNQYLRAKEFAKIINLYHTKMKDSIKFDEINIDNLVEITDNFSGADIENIYNKIIEIIIEYKMNDIEEVIITEKIMIQVINQIKQKN
jgi:hypothetical protein